MPTLKSLPTEGNNSSFSKPDEKVQRRRRKGQKRRPTPYVRFVHRQGDAIGLFPIMGGELFNLPQEWGVSDSELESVIEPSEHEHPDSDENDIPPLETGSSASEPAYRLPPENRIPYNWGRRPEAGHAAPTGSVTAEEDESSEYDNWEPSVPNEDDLMQSHPRYG